MKRLAAPILLAIGLALGVVSVIVLPRAGGRFEYAVQVADPRPVSESSMPAGLERLGAIRAVVAESPGSAGAPRRVLLLARLAAVLGSSDVALGALPGEGPGKGLAGAASGIARGALTVAGREVVVSGILQELGPLFDESLVMQSSPTLIEAFEAANWNLQARYLIVAGSWEERADVLARLEGDAALLPEADAEIISPARPPRLSHGTKRALSVVLIACGLSVLAWQLRGLSRGEIERRLGRG